MKRYFLLLLLIVPTAVPMQLHKSWSTAQWCSQVLEPHWPFAYSKSPSSSVAASEPKGRTARSVQNFAHECKRRGVQSTCSRCEEIDCDVNGRCHFQVQGVQLTDLHTNIPTVSDTPWAVGGSHRNDFGSSSHACVMLSGGLCSDPTAVGSFDFRDCAIRCWGYRSNLPTEKDFPVLSPDPMKDRHETVGWEWDEKLLEKRPQGKVVTIAGSTQGVAGHRDGLARDALFNNPTSVAVDREGNVFIVDSGNHCIRRLDNATKIVSTIAGVPGTAGYADGAASSALFDNPTGITLYYDWGVKVDSRTGAPVSNGIGELILIISDTNNHRLRRIVFQHGQSLDQLTVETLAGRKGQHPEPGYADGDAIEARFNMPAGIAADDAGIVFVADSYNHLIRQVHPNGDVITLAGKIGLPEDIDVSDPAQQQACPPPCLRGIPGDTNGPLNEAQFFFPLDVSIGLQNTILVVDSNRVRIVTRNGTVSIIQGTTYENTVASIAGAFGIDSDGKRDGAGDEATFNAPASVTMDTLTGRIYIADTASCRVRRIRPADQVVEPLTCGTRLVDIVRPSGCTSYELPTDALFLQHSDVIGNIHYRYEDRDKAGLQEGWTTAEYSFLGRRLYRCQGSPPPSRGTTSTGETLGPRGGTGNEEYIHDEDTGQGTALYVSCPSGCASQASFQVFGTQPYADDSSICRSAVHSGLIDDTTGGMLRVVIVPDIETDLSGSSANGVTSQPRTGGARRSFRIESYSIQQVQVSTLAGRPAAPLEDPCGVPGDEEAAEGGYHLPLQSAFNNPRGITIPANTSTSSSSFVFVADTGNHAIRAISAVCSKVCENGGECVSDEICSCAPGWTGSDCTTPVCSSPCSSSMHLCVAPDTCDCIPGFGNFPACDQPLCAQTCEHGGQCGAPDTCVCASGWIDANCTTPVCEQTCGNGGNCTAPNTCTCPSDWTGTDCRTPVCTQTCLNGGSCTAPDTCTCAPSWSGHDCSLPVCNQGFLVADPSSYTGSASGMTSRQADAGNRPLAGRGQSLASEIAGTSWRQYIPCDDSFPQDWCTATNEFDCSQEARIFSTHHVLRGETWRSVTGFHDNDDSQVGNSSCVRIEVSIGARTQFPYERETFPNDLTPLWRFPPATPYGWNASFAPGPYREEDRLQGVDGWRPWSFAPSDRMVAHVKWVEMQQGVYVCANGGTCTAPDTCVCAPGWAGFDCRTPICEQGYFEPPSSAHPGFIEFEDALVPQRYPNQGLYECSVRAFTEWENPDFLFEHPNYYSRYMDHHAEEWSSATRYQLVPEDPHYWDDMGWPATYVHTEPEGNHTNRGWTRNGYWQRIPGTRWKKGKCTVEFTRHCPRDLTKGLDVRTLQHGTPVADTESAFRSIIYHTDEKTRAVGRWSTIGGECIDHVHRGCKNNGTCVAPNTCECAPGWTGPDCTIPVCEQSCSRNGIDQPDLGFDNNGLKIFQKGIGWCTLPNTCTCERGWTGHDCSVALCAQECNNNGRCSAPDTCTCARWRSSWWDAQRDGGQPFFQDDTGEPQLTGWTGYDCNTPICVQGEKFVLNDFVGSERLGGYGLILFGQEPETNIFRPDLRNPPYLPYTLSNDIPPVKIWLPSLREHNLALWAKPEMFFEEANRLCRMQKQRFCQSFPDASPLRPAWAPGDGEVVRNDGRSYQSGCKPWSERFSDTLEGVSEGYLCNVMEWEQGDYNYGRYIRINNDATNYRRIEGIGGLQQWEKVPTESPGEGIYACYNKGSCIAPDTCECPDGYTGLDCSEPLCRHVQVDGTLVSCVNGGKCVEKDKCECVQADSLLHLTHPQVPKGKTGFTGTDCSIPICMQGTFDPLCDFVTPGGEGCFRCKNGGNCTAPDFCTCPPEWTGHDCGTPVCQIRADEQVIADLGTTELSVVQAFELDPCQSSRTFFWNGAKTGRGNCTAPNTCTCTCMNRAWKDENDEWTDEPWHHPLGRLPPAGYVEGTLQCVEGFEGLKNYKTGLFESCHLAIYTPKWYERLAITLIVLSAVFVLMVVGVYLYIRRRIRQKYLLARAERRLTMEDNEVVPLRKRKTTKKKRRTARKVA